MTTKTGDQTSGGDAPQLNIFQRLSSILEIDLRLLSMVVALAIIWIAFNIRTEGIFLSARNLWNLSVQSSVVGVMATGMVLVIVARHIDLSVGSILGFVGMVLAVLQVEVFQIGAGWNWWVTVLMGLAIGALIGLFQGFWIAYLRVPAFIVTLGGLLIFRGGAWLMTRGRTVAPLDTNFQILGGGINGSIGGLWSWVLGIAAIVLIAWLTFSSRSRRRRYGFPVKPWWAELLVLAVAIAAVVLFVDTMNSYNRPRTEIARGIAVPVLIMIVVAVAMSMLVRFTRFGRYVYAMGGNPEAARLSGVDTRRVTLAIFVIMGVLCAIAGIIASARLNAGANSTGTLAELSVIAAAVIGGTSLAGGVGTIAGAVLGTVLIASLTNGMVLMGLSTAMQNVIQGTGADRGGVARRGLPAPPRSLRRISIMAQAIPLVEMRHIYKYFGGVHAVEDVTIDLFPGEVVGIVGHNGAGKSTLIKMLSGAYAADSGDIIINGEKATIQNPRDARKYGIETIYQTLALADNLDAPANIFLGREVMRSGVFLNDDAMEAESRKVLDRLKLNLPSVKEPVANLSGGQRQAVAIGRAIYFDARILIMDEPTAALGPQETAQGGRPDQAAQGRGPRHLPDQPRPARRVRPLRPGQRAQEREAGGNREDRGRDPRRGAGHDHRRGAAQVGAGSGRGLNPFGRWNSSSSSRPTWVSPTKFRS